MTTTVCTKASFWPNSTSSRFQDAVAVKRAAVDTAAANLSAAKATVRDIEAQARARRWGLQNAVEDVDNKIALLHARAAALDKSKAELTLAQADFYRAQRLLGTPAESRQQFDRAQRTLSTASAQVTESLAEVFLPGSGFFGSGRKPMAAQVLTKSRRISIKPFLPSSGCEAPAVKQAEARAQVCQTRARRG